MFIFSRIILHTLIYKDNFLPCGFYMHTHTRMASTRAYTSWNKSSTVRTRERTYPDWSRISRNQSRFPPYLMRYLGVTHHTDITPYHSPLSAQGEGSNTNMLAARSRMSTSWRHTVPTTARIWVDVKTLGLPVFYFSHAEYFNIWISIIY